MTNLLESGGVKYACLLYTPSITPKGYKEHYYELSPPVKIQEELHRFVNLITWNYEAYHDIFIADPKLVEQHIESQARDLNAGCSILSLLGCSIEQKSAALGIENTFNLIGYTTIPPVIEYGLYDNVLL